MGRNDIKIDNWNSNRTDQLRASSNTAVAAGGFSGAQIGVVF